MKRIVLHILFSTIYLPHDIAFGDRAILSDLSVTERMMIALKICAGYLLLKMILVYFLLYVLLDRIIRQGRKMSCILNRKMFLYLPQIPPFIFEYRKVKNKNLSG